MAVDIAAMVAIFTLIGGLLSSLIIGIWRLAALNADNKKTKDTALAAHTRIDKQDENTRARIDKQDEKIEALESGFRAEVKEFFIKLQDVVLISHRVEEKVNFLIEERKQAK